MTHPVCNFCLLGGGVLENLPRVLPSDVACVLDSSSWSPIPPVFDWISRNGNVSSHEMLRTFNCGIGGILVVSENNTTPVLAKLHGLSNEAAYVIGVLKKRRETEPQVVVNGDLDSSFL